jgi:hypothetical protein
MSATDMLIPDSLAWIGKRAADYLHVRGWCRRVMQERTGAVCQIGALRAAEQEPGEWVIARAVVRRRGQGEEWNDAPGRTRGEVEDALGGGGPITAPELADTFGPQWAEVCVVIRRAARLTCDERRRLATCREPGIQSVVNTHRGRFPHGHAATAHDAVLNLREAGGLPVGLSVTATAAALTTRHLIGSEGYTFTDYDRMTFGWRRALGPIHRDDPAPTTHGCAATGWQPIRPNSSTSQRTEPPHYDRARRQRHHDRTQRGGRDPGIARRALLGAR